MKKYFLITLIAAFLVGNSYAEAMSNKGKKPVDPPTEEMNLAAEDHSTPAPAVEEPATPATPAVVATAPVETPAAAPKEPAVSSKNAAPKQVAKPAPKKATTTKKVALKKSVAKKKTTAKTAAKPTGAKKPATVQKAKPSAAVEEKVVATEPKVEKKYTKPAVSMAETKAYELFKDGNYDVAAPYFVRMATEKNFVFTDEMNFESVDNIVRKYVDAHMARFLVKGEFEKTVSYVSRVGEENRNKKIQSLAGTIFDELKQRERKAVNIKDFKLSRYYADDEAFILLSPDGDYVINVEMAGARSFKNNFTKLQIKDMDFTVDSGVLLLAYFTLVNPDNNKRYTFNSGISTTYDVAEIEKFYTDRLGAGIPKATQAVVDTTKAIRSITPPAEEPAELFKKPATSNEKITPKTEEVTSLTQQEPTKSNDIVLESTEPKAAATEPTNEASDAIVTVKGDEMTLEN